ncbi:MAG: hypothetical protein NZT92_19500 [Abditibacteriales bacterium]|nr:hypothetical protein [Abditibacteriales bacterium]
MNRRDIYLLSLAARNPSTSSAVGRAGMTLTLLEDFHAWTQSDAFKQAHADRPPAEMFAGPNVFEMHEVVMQTERP